MLELRSDSLVVSILDPNDPADADKNGARYCTGGPRHLWPASAFTLSEQQTDPTRSHTSI